MTPCAECGTDIMYLSDLGCEPGVCGYCGKYLCPTCDNHGECTPKINAHNQEVEKRRIQKEIEVLTKKLEAME